MHHRILVIEQTDTLRSVTETVLRQNGYDVIAVTAAEKAREVLGLSKPDLIILGADLVAPDGTPYYEQIRQEPQTANIPLLLFEPSDKSALAFPDEIIISLPFDPKDLVYKVSVFLGGKDAAPAATAGPLGESDIDDDFLDAALGLDQINVTESEVMDKTVIGKHSEQSSGNEKMIGLDSTSGIEVSGTENSTVESLVIDDDSSQIKHRKPGRQTPPLEGTGKLEILTDRDQFALNESGGAQDEDAAHDYDWFVDAIKEDADTPKIGPSDSGSLTFADPSTAIDPITPGPTSPSPAKPAVTPSSDGVGKFIDEFKKEMEQIQTDPDQLFSEPQARPSRESNDEMSWDEKLEQLGPAQIDTFTKEFAHELGRRVAEIIVAKIDPDKLLRLIRKELIDRRGKPKN